METKNCPACFQSIDVRATRCSHCASRQPDAPSMHRDLPGRVLGGVCTALALQFGWDPLLVRVLVVSSAALSGGMVFWAYALIWLMTPFEANSKAPATKLIDWVTGLFSGPSSTSPAA